MNKTSMIIIAVMAYTILLVSAYSTIHVEKEHYYSYDITYKDVVKQQYYKTWVNEDCKFNLSVGKQVCDLGHWEEGFNKVIETIPINGEVVAVTVGTKRFNGVVNYDTKKGTVSKFLVPTGKRNMEEFGYCLPHEISKGVCIETKIN